MIKVGILGADSPIAGEIIRILIHHPDVDIRSLYAPASMGKPVDIVHHGLIGEKPLSFSDTIDPGKLDFLFILDDNTNLSSLPDNLKWIDMSGHSWSSMSESTVYGLSEAFRKPLVRGARHAFLPNPVASVSLISLNPVALNLLLGGDLKIDIELPDGFESEEIPGLLKEAEEELLAVIPLIQNSFNGKINLTVKKHSGSTRAMKVGIVYRCLMDIADIARLYNNVYDDHNFSFLVDRPVSAKEVEGTNKCILRLTRPDSDSVRIESIVDPTMRGGAGEAVHIMNLLCGLYEKTGLALKSISI